MCSIKLVLMIGLLTVSYGVFADPVGSTFTYQGELRQLGQVANGSYDFKFDLYDVEVDGAALTGPVQLEEVNVQDGVFTVDLDFGSDVFDGTQLWLGVAVREGTSVDAYVTMNPRQRLTATPYASTALNSIGNNCTAITSIPYIIAVEGVYCFTGNLESSLTTGHAIEIQADDVVINLNGWKLDGVIAGDATEANGIFAYQHQNITIRNGAIQGFYRAIHLIDFKPYAASRNHLIEDIHATRNTYVGMDIRGSNSLVRNNQVLDTGGSTANGEAWGIYAEGTGLRILENDIVNVVSPESNGEGYAYGIIVGDADGGIIMGNRIENINAQDSFSGIGIRIDRADDVLVVDNRITNADIGVTFDFLNSASGKYMNNLTSSVGEPFVGGTPIGIND